MKSIFKNSIIAAALLFGAVGVTNAQVKVGANPAAIGTNSNLEVEAANGNKTIVDKATGKVTIQDGTQAAGRVLTSDASGGSSWQTAVAQPSPSVLLSVQSTTNQTVSGIGATTLTYTTKLFDDGNNFTLPSTFTAPSDGRYMITMHNSSAGIATYNGRTLEIRVTGSQNYSKTLQGNGVSASDGHDGSASIIIALKAGDQVTTKASAYGANYTVTVADLQIMKVGN